MPKSKEQKRQEAIARAAGFFDVGRRSRKFDSLEDYLDLFRPKGVRSAGVSGSAVQELTIGQE